MTPTMNNFKLARLTRCSIQVLIIILFAWSCTKDKESKVISTFPTILLVDTIEIIDVEVFDMNGRLDNYDEKFAYFDTTIIVNYDSLVITDPVTCLEYRHSGRFDFVIPSVDTLDLFLAEDYFKTIPVNLPEVMIRLDTREEINYLFSEDKTEISEASLMRYYSDHSSFAINLFAVRIYTRVSLPIETYNIAGQSRLNSVNKELLFQNLDSNETLSVIRYKIALKQSK